MRFSVVTLLFLLIITPLLNAAASEPLRVVAARTVYHTFVIDWLIDGFQELHPDAKFDVATMGSLQALDEARQGNADIVITYYPPEELRLLKDGVVTNRIEFMFGAYAIFGPPGDKLGLLQEPTIQDVLRKLAVNKVAFITSSPRGGTYQKIADLWASAGIEPDWPWYEIADTSPLGSMRLAAEQGAYTLADLGTYLLNQQELSESLVPLYQGGYALRKPFSIMQINYDRIPRVKNPLAAAFVEFVASDAGQQIISHANQEIFNAPVLFPLAHLDPGVMAQRASEKLERTTRNLYIVTGLLIVTGGLLLIVFYMTLRVRHFRKKQMNAEIAREVAEQASKEKSKFISRMSHELRTPMNAILGFSQLLSLDEEDPEKRENLQYVLMAGEHLQHLIDDVLALNNIERDRVSISLREVVIDDLIKECLLYSDEMINKNKLKVVVTGDLQYKVHADPVRLKEVLLNLISNAAKYNVVEGTITIEVKKIADLDRLCISVTDTGHGLSQEQQRHLFEPFERLGAEATEIEGTGIGLVISKNLIELMHGKFGFESTHGRGSRFWVELDLADNGLASMQQDVNN